MNNLYNVLGIDSAATAAEIRAAYLTKAKESHPDAGGSTTTFSKVRFAYEVLSDEKRRRDYDLSGCADNSNTFINAGALSIIDNLIEILLERSDASQSDAIGTMTAEAAAALSVKTTALRNLEMRRSAIIDLKSRFKPNDPTEKTVDELLDKKLAALNVLVCNEQLASAQLREVINILARYQFARKTPIDLSAFGPPVDDLLDTTGRRAGRTQR